MADYPYAHGAKYATYGVNTGTSNGTTLTANAAANTKGNYSGLTSATTFPCSGLFVHVAHENQSNTFLVDIAIGGAGSEQVVISNIMFRSSGGTAITFSPFFPINLPSGVRIAARCQSGSGGAAVKVSVTLVQGGFASHTPFSVVTTYGAATANSGGTQYQTSGTAANTKSPYQQLTASTTAPVKALLIITGNSFSGDSGSGLFDIAVGAGGSETILIPNLAYAADLTHAEQMLSYGPFPCSIPAGTRLSYREQTNVPNASNYTIMVVYAFT